MKITFLAIAVLVILTGCKDDPTAVDAWYAAHEKNLAHTEAQRKLLAEYKEKPGTMLRLSIETNYQLLVDHARALKTRIGGGDVDADIKGHKGI
jgi:ABC-type glycerol-3-phosphate transport system substrate-binding protein